jgi:hypothetical protein
MAFEGNIEEIIINDMPAGCWAIAYDVHTRPVSDDLGLGWNHSTGGRFFSPGSSCRQLDATKQSYFLL